jgi:hypothetical protein
MPIFHEGAQYSEEYDRLKIGIPTSSNFHKIITPQGKPSRQWRDYACVLIAERILQQRIEFYNSPAMARVTFGRRSDYPSFANLANVPVA